MLQAIRYRAGTLEILDQLRLPHESCYLTLPDADAAWEAIHSMKVRGAPAIAMVAALGLSSELTRVVQLPGSRQELAAHIHSRLEYLKTSRPTAVNLANMATHFEEMADALAKQQELSVEAMRDAICAEAESMLAADVAANRAIGQHGAEHIATNCQVPSVGKLGVLTHCNTGSLATAGYGTALEAVTLALRGVAVDLDDVRARLLRGAAADSSGRTSCDPPSKVDQQRSSVCHVTTSSRGPSSHLGLAIEDAVPRQQLQLGNGDGGRCYILATVNEVCDDLEMCDRDSTSISVVRHLHERGWLECAYCTETRPYNQGSRLTAFELLHDHIPATLICDSMAAALMATGKVHAVVVGADRVTANGDTANKIGTYQLAICAKHHGVPFYVASPTTTVDSSKSTGSEIPIEERPAREMTSIQGIQLAPAGIDCWNPAFDVTPGELITGGIITEKGVFPASRVLDSLGV